MYHSKFKAGFTLLEIIATLVILSILAAVAIPRYISVDESAKQRAIDAGIAELDVPAGWRTLQVCPRPSSRRLPCIRMRSRPRSIGAFPCEC